MSQGCFFLVLPTCGPTKKTKTWWMGDLPISLVAYCRWDYYCGLLGTVSPQQRHKVLFLQTFSNFPTLPKCLLKTDRTIFSEGYFQKWSLKLTNASEQNSKGFQKKGWPTIWTFRDDMFQNTLITFCEMAPIRGWSSSCIISSIFVGPRCWAAKHPHPTYPSNATSTIQLGRIIFEKVGKSDPPPGYPPG